MERYLILGGEMVKATTDSVEIPFTVTAKDPVLGRFIGAAHAVWKGKEAKKNNTLLGREVYQIKTALKDGALVETAPKGAAVGVIDAVKTRGICGRCCGLGAKTIPIAEAKVGPAVLHNEVVGDMPIEITKIHENIFVYSYQGEICGGMSGSPILQDGSLVGAHPGRNTEVAGEAFGIHIKDMVEELLLGGPERPITEFRE